MRYYIVNKLGWILGESESKLGAELILAKYSDEEIEEQEIEIIDESIEENHDYVEYVPTYSNDKRSITIEDLERLLVKRYGTAIETGCNSWEGGWFSVEEILKTVSENI